MRETGFTRRAEQAALPAHVEAGHLIEQFGGVAALGAMYDRLLPVIAHRPSAQLVSCPGGAIGAVYLQLIARLEALPSTDVESG
jgi:hypothetical protein